MPHCVTRHACKPSLDGVFSDSLAIATHHRMTTAASITMFDSATRKRTRPSLIRKISRLTTQPVVKLVLLSSGAYKTTL